MSKMRLGTLDDIKASATAAGDYITKIYGHWSAGRYEPNATDLSDYHILILNDGSYLIRDDFTEKLAHTWHRNTGAVGIAFAGCYGAITSDLGDYPPTEEQIAGMAMAVKIICEAIVKPVDIFMTHAEIATIDGYGPGSGDPETRWDLLFLRNGENTGTGGDTIRKLASM